MDIRKLQRAIVDGLEDVKAANILVFNTEHLSALFERVIIASGTSNRQTKSLAASVRDAVKASGFPVLRTEGESNGEWIIVDCGAAVAHIMQPAIRDYYHLEEIWGDKPVKIKLEARKTGLVKASPVDGDDEDEDDEDDVVRAPLKPAAKRATTPGRTRPLGTVKPREPAKKKTSVPGTAAGRAAVAAAALAADKTAAGRAAPGKTAAAKTPASKSPARKTAAAKAPAKTPAKTAFKTAAGKTPARKVAAKGAVTRTVGTKGAAPTSTQVVRTIVVKSAPRRAAGIGPAAKAALKTAPRRSAGSAAGKTAPRKTSTRK